MHLPLNGIRFHPVSSCKDYIQHYLLLHMTRTHFQFKPLQKLPIQGSTSLFSCTKCVRLTSSILILSNLITPYECNRHLISSTMSLCFCRHFHPQSANLLQNLTGCNITLSCNSFFTPRPSLMTMHIFVIVKSVFSPPSTSVTISSFISSS